MRLNRRMRMPVQRSIISIPPHLSRLAAAAAAAEGEVAIGAPCLPLAYLPPFSVAFIAVQELCCVSM